MGGVPPVQGAPIQQGGGVMTPVGGQNPGGMQPMGWRAKGGRIGYPLKDGSGGGEGRLEKIRAYGAKAKETEKK